MKYFVCDAQTRTALSGPMERAEADQMHYRYCSQGVPNGDGTFDNRVRCVVVCEEAFTPNELGNHYRNTMAEHVAEKVKATK
jgi:hypothetical protein